MARFLEFGLAVFLATAAASCGAEAPVDPSQDAELAVGGAFSMRFELAGPMCDVPRLQSGEGCPADDDKCLCRPEFDAINTPKGSPGNPNGKVVILSQPRYGKLADSTFAFDAYAAIKAHGNFVGHYVNSLNPARSCTAAQSWSGVACDGNAGCGWRCIPGAARANEIVDEEVGLYGADLAPKWVALNEAWSILFQRSDVGTDYRVWIRDLVEQMAQRNKRPLLYVQERHVAAGPFTLLGEIAKHAWFGVEAYLSGHDVLGAPGQCKAPFDETNWCRRKYDEIRESVRRSASPVIPLSRLIMIEHFSANKLHFVDKEGKVQMAGWGRTFDDDPKSPTFGTPSMTMWNTIVERRDRAMKTLPSLAGVGSYSWAGNASGATSAERVEIAQTHASVVLP